MKSIFISFLPTYAFITFIYSIVQLIRIGGIDFIWLGIANFVIAILFVLIFSKPKARTGPNLHGLSIVIIALGALSIFYASELLVIVLAILTILNWILYVYWYSRFSGRNKGVIQQGQSLPSFEVTTTNKQEVIIPEYYGKPLLILFFRGNWCPLCMAQIKEISRKYQQIAERGTEILLISPQPIRHTKSLAKRFNVPFTFLIDQGGQAAKRLGIFHSLGTPFGLSTLGYEKDTVMPTVIMTDQ
ncbi:MAG: redoxin domain-containing protein, partial [Bacteroidota bacterium]